MAASNIKRPVFLLTKRVPSALPGVTASVNSAAPPQNSSATSSLGAVPGLLRSKASHSVERFGSISGILSRTRFHSSHPRFEDLTLAYARAYAKGLVREFFPELAPVGRAYFLERMIPVVGEERARAMEFAAVLEMAYPGRSVDELMMKVDATEEMGTIREMGEQIDELLKMGIDETASWQWFQANLRGGTRDGFERSLAVLLRQLSKLRILIEKTVVEGELSYARMTHILLGYVEFVESVNYQGMAQKDFREHSHYQYFVDPDRAFPKLCSELPRARFLFRMEPLQENFPFNLIHPIFQKIDQGNLDQYLCSSYIVGKHPVQVTKVKEFGLSFDGNKISPEAANQDLSIHDLDHSKDTGRFLRELRRTGAQGFCSDPQNQGLQNWFLPPSLAALLSQTSDTREQVFFARGWLAEKGMALDRYIAAQSGKFESLARTLGFYFRHDASILGSVSLSSHYGVCLYLQRLSEQGLAWQDVLPYSVRFSLFSGFLTYIPDGLFTDLQDQDANLGENLLPYKSRDFSAENLRKVWEDIAATFEFPVGAELRRIPIL